MKKDPDNQLFFDFDAPPPVPVQDEDAVEKSAVCTENTAVETVAGDPCKVDKFALLQAVLAHLISDGASGAALQVPCRLRKFQADVAAYYSCYRRRLNELERTIVIDVYTRRSQCLPESAGHEAMLEELCDLRDQRTAMEAQIKIDEPGLWVEEELFDEFRTFDYTRSTNKEYHKLCRRIASLQQSLFKGTRMERLAKSDVADYLVMAVPEGLLSVKEIPDNWGLWYIMPDKSVKVVVEPVLQECSGESRLHLVQNIGHAALRNVLFANGVKIKANGQARFTRQPKARRK